MTLPDRARVREALAHVPANDRDTWLKMGMAVKSELGDDGYDLWDEWSQRDDSYDERDARSVWRSISPNGKVTSGTLFHEAKRHGYATNGSHTPIDPSPEETARREREACEYAERDARQRESAATKALAIWKAASPAGANNPYLARKQVDPVASLREIHATRAAGILGYAPKSSGELLTGPLLVVPVKRGDALSTLEMIDGSGRKSALAGGAKSGGYWATHPLPKSDGHGLTLLIGEGVATVLSGQKATGHISIAALSCTNLATVAKAMRENHPKATLVILADLGNGQTHAEEAARSVAGLLAVPQFGEDRPEGATDFNDLVRCVGIDAIKRALANAKAPDISGAQPEPRNATGLDLTLPEWPELQTLTQDDRAGPYPVASLPLSVRAAIDEVQAFTQAPVALVAASALSAVSVAVQGLANVQRDEGLTGPIGLWLLTIAESGERKSTADGHFARAIRDYEAEQAEVNKADIARHAAAVEAWEAKRAGLREAIKSGSRAGTATDIDEDRLRALQADAPKPPLVPRLLYSDATPEALAHGMSRWPSAAVISAEAGAVLGAHAMKSDSIVRTLALLNSLWDGGELRVDRRTTESFTLRGARLTISLQAQAAAMRDYFDKAGPVARGVGFFARFLMAWPRSTQGSRQYREAPKSLPALSSFNRRIAALLDIRPPINDRGELEAPLLMLSPAAKTDWIRFYNDVEAELGTGGDMVDVRDVASKAAHNAARLAAVLHVFEHGVSGSISTIHLVAACQIVAWHLTEARRFLGEFSLPPATANAARLDAWLIDYARTEGVGKVGRRVIQRIGPNATRDGKKLDEALNELFEAGGARESRHGNRRDVEIRPQLLKGQA